MAKNEKPSIWEGIIEDGEDESLLKLTYRALVLVVGLWLITGLALFFYKDRGSFGDMFGVVNALFSGLAFAGIILTILLQKKELALQRAELKETRSVFQEQSKTLALQRFENTFFQLLRSFQDIVNGMNLIEPEDEENFTEGRDSFRFLYEFWQANLGLRPSQIEEIHESRELRLTEFEPLDSALVKYHYVYWEYQGDLGHYFRHFYTILKVIDQSHSDEAVQDPYRYSGILRSILSSYELVFIFYNGLSKHGNPKLKNLLERYSMLKNMDNGLVINQQHINEYHPMAIATSEGREAMLNNE